MSEFTDGVTAPEETPQQEEPQTEDYLEQMVGEGKKYQSVEEAAKALAKKAVNADSFIETLKTEKQQLEEQYNELQTRNKSIDEIVAALKEPEPKMEEPKQTPEQQQLTVEQILAELENRTQQKTMAQQRAEAIDAAWNKLGSQEVFGDLEKAKVAVASYIGKDESKKALVDQLAIADPDGLITLLKQRQDVVTFSEDLSSKSINGNTPQGKLTWEACKHIRKDNPKLYYSKAFQNRMHTEL